MQEVCGSDNDETTLCFQSIILLISWGQDVGLGGEIVPPDSCGHLAFCLIEGLTCFNLLPVCVGSVGSLS